MSAKKSMGFRVDTKVQEELETVAKKERRSLSTVIGALVEVGLRSYNKGGWAALNEGNNNEQI